MREHRAAQRVVRNFTFECKCWVWWPEQGCGQLVIRHYIYMQYTIVFSVFTLLSLQSELFMGSNQWIQLLSAGTMISEHVSVDILSYSYMHM